LRDDDRVRHFCIVTNRSDPEGGSGLDLVRWHRQKAGTIEHAHDVRMNELAGVALPSQKFGATLLGCTSTSSYNRASEHPFVYVIEEKRLCCSGCDPVGCLGFRRARSVMVWAADVARSARLKIHGPSGKGWLPWISPASAASLSCLGGDVEKLRSFV
jgi:hypothetical protein